MINFEAHTVRNHQDVVLAELSGLPVPDRDTESWCSSGDNRISYGATETGDSDKFGNYTILLTDTATVYLCDECLEYVLPKLLDTP